MELKGKIVSAAKWSGGTEVISRLIGFVSSMVLARLLTPDAFGAVATIMMVVTFAELFTDAGFQKYIIQHEFSSDDDREKSTQVAFWTNLALSMLLWGLIIIFRDPIATLAGSPDLGMGIAVACVSIPLAAFSSIQMASFKRDFDFRRLFIVRMVASLIPLVITIPLALILRSFWALVAGTILTNLSNAVLLTVFSKWKPRFYFDFGRLKSMLSFSVLTIVESVSIWLTNYVDIFIVGAMLNQHLLGIYKTSMTVVGQFTGIITAATTPILFSGLSRLQNDNKSLRELFLRFQKAVAILMVPLGVGLYLYKDLVTGIVLGGQWAEASGFIGVWGITSALMILLSHYCSEVFRAKGKPALSVLAQWIYLAFLVPVLLVFVRGDFTTFYWARSAVRLVLIVVNMFIMLKLIGLRPIQMIENIFPEAFACIFMAYAATLMQKVSGSIAWGLAGVAVCACVYFTALTIFSYERSLVRKTLALASDKFRILLRRLTVWLAPVLPDALFLRLMFRAKTGKRLHLRKALSFNEKMQWLKLYFRRPEMISMVDKAEAKNFIADRIGPEYVNPTLGIWDRAADIDFTSLPEQFVLKTTHDCGGIVICRGKDILDREDSLRTLDKALGRSYWLQNREWPYKGVVPRIIAEPYLEDEFGELRDYKFFCFNGEPRIMFVATGRSSKEETCFDFFDMDYRHLNIINGHPNAAVPPQKPRGFEEMKRLAARLSEGFPFLRVDFYEVGEKIYTGELTFFHWSGFVPFEPPAWDLKLGSWLELPDKQKSV